MKGEALQRLDFTSLNGSPSSGIQKLGEFITSRQELQKTRDQYFTNISGERRFNLEHKNVIAAREYGNLALNTTLRAVAEERNDSDMLELKGLPLREMIGRVRAKRRIHLLDAESGAARREILLPHDYPLATGKKSEGDRFGKDEHQWSGASFYHDARMILEGIFVSDIPDKLTYAQGVVENFIYEIMLLDYVGNGSLIDIITRSQIMSLPQMGWRVFEEKQKVAATDKERAENIEWLRTVMEVSQYEYKTYWQNEKHAVKDSKLITPADTDVSYNHIAACENSQDMEWETYGRPHDFFSPRFVSAFINYPILFERFEKEYGDPKKADFWKGESDAMIKEFREKLWDEKTKSFRAYDARSEGLTEEERLSEVLMLGQYMTMYIKGIATEEQAAEMVKQLDRFEMDFGFSNIDIDTVPERYTDEELNKVIKSKHMVRTVQKEIYPTKQWGDWGKEKKQQHPNDFPIVGYELVQGLENYGYIDKAIHVAETQMFALTEFYKNNGIFAEKINALTGEKGNGGFYEGQIGFGWTIGLYLWLLQELPKLYDLRKQKAIAAGHDVFVSSHIDRSDFALAA